MNKRTLAILLAVAAVLAAVWLANIFDLQPAATQQEALPLSGLVTLDAPEQQTSTAEPVPAQTQPQPEETQPPIDEDGAYTAKEDVSLYLFVYGRLPDNFITKTEARALGWSGGGLDSYAYGKCIGGDRFGNYEGLLPEADGRTYYECDIDTLHGDSRGAKRIVYSDDGLVYYTEDHYESFELLYGEP